MARMSAPSSSNRIARRPTRSDEYPPVGGGGGVVCKGLAEALVQMGYEIDVVTAGMKGLPAYEEVKGVRIHSVRCMRRYRHYVTLSEMCTMILPLYRKGLELVQKNHYHHLRFFHD